MRAEKVRQKKLLRDQDLALGGETRATLEHTYGDYDERDGLPLQKSLLGSRADLYAADNSADRYGADRSYEHDDSLFEVAPPQGISLTVKKQHNPKQRSTRVDGLLARQGSLPVSGEMARELLGSYDNSAMVDAYQLSTISRPMRVRNASVQGSEGRQYYDGTVRNVAPPIRALSIGRSLAREQIRLYEPSEHDGEGLKYV